ncbi:MAG: hypothetical protein A2901_09805 [Elusimicrobia bacterium RIFCSPLOWO2_01_FULL_54_10]|nr:MAG: hypothetical protein A2901_09805 [Elusimicrobia bacterium RIFCSPLOWO2_01_FULL_54_10]
MDKKLIHSVYHAIVKENHKKYLEKYGVGLPKLTDASGNFTKDSLVLVYLAQGYPKTKKVSKEELTNFIRSYYPRVNDVQQARHLGAQKGWWIAAGGRDNIVVKLIRGEYQLHTLEEPYPHFKMGHRISDTGDWEQIKMSYHLKCATCGSQEGEPHLHWPATKTLLQKGHMDPRKPLAAGNIIPQCQKCNRGDRNRWVYDEKGRVIKISNPGVIRTSDREVRKGVYKILYAEFKGRNPAKMK